MTILHSYLSLTGWQVHGFVCDMKTMAKNKAQTYFYQKNQLVANISIFVKSLTPNRIRDISKIGERPFFEEM